MESFFDPLWYRVAALTPRLRSHVRVHRHRYRGQLWYVLQDNTTGRFHRFTPAAYELIGRMDGRRTVQAIWDLACERLGDAAPSQSAAVRLLHQLHAADVLQSDSAPDTEELVRRHARHRRQRWLQQVRSPVFQRLPLLDPDRGLERCASLIRLAFSGVGAIVWSAVAAAGLLTAAVHWSELTADAADRILTPRNLLLLWLAFPFVKALHELGHAAAVKAWGGEVHEVGLAFLVFSPVPYVEASAASAFPDKGKRVIVGAAGMAVEVFLAALALLVWAQVEPGLVRTLMYDVVVIASVSTVLFNGNPLLRFDAYYMLADALEIPNLASRANRYVFYLVDRYLFGVEDSESPATERGERGWFVAYALAAFVYRIFIYFVIISFIISTFLYLGVALAVWAAFSMFLLPIGKGLRYLATGPRLRRQRGRAGLASASILALVAAVTLFVPVPLATIADGVVWAPEDAIVRAGAAGFVTALRATPGEEVTTGQALVELDDAVLRAEARRLEAELEALAARLRRAVRQDRIEAQITQLAVDDAQARIGRVRERLSELVVHSPDTGRFIFPDAEDWLGRYVGQGERLAFVLGEDNTTIRVAVAQGDVDLVRRRTESIAVRSAIHTSTVHPARLLREVPSGTRELPSAALGAGGGGGVDLDPSDETGTRSLEQLFHFELELPERLRAAPIGSRVHVRFGHGSEPLARRWYRGLRQLFLRQLGV